ncbi:Type VII secretion system protein EssB [Frankliniella fusca]|uniref:Type VII secretion system protein EssB n=1 Tax=Frankliniella fusca TaxID=407009 RepID=A0AAE1HMC2_9NEOP|nr:Type VII secretion system protein EssB [Frankliniella fusca]
MRPNLSTLLFRYGETYEAWTDRLGQPDVKWPIRFQRIVISRKTMSLADIPEKACIPCIPEQASLPDHAEQAASISTLDDDLVLSDSASSDDESARKYQTSNMEMFERDMDSLLYSMESLEPGPSVVIQGSASNLITSTPEMRKRVPIMKQRIRPRSACFDISPVKPLKRPLEVSSASSCKRQKKNEAVKEEKVKLRALIDLERKEKARKRQVTEEKARARKEELAKATEEKKQNKAKAADETKQKEVKEKKELKRRSTSIEKEKVTKRMRENITPVQDSEDVTMSDDVSTDGSAAASSSAGDCSMKIDGETLKFEMNAKLFGEKIIKTMMSKCNTQRSTQAKSTTAVTFRVKNMSGKTVQHWCPLCEKHVANISTHVSKPTKKEAEFHEGADTNLLVAYHNQIFTRGMRGPINVASLAKEILKIKDKEALVKKLKNAFSAFGIGTVTSDSESFPLQDMSTVFSKGFPKNHDDEVEEQADQEIAEGD